MPTSPLNEAGMRIEPPRSVPTANGEQQPRAAASGEGALEGEQRGGATSEAALQGAREAPRGRSTGAPGADDANELQALLGKFVEQSAKQKRRLQRRANAKEKKKEKRLAAKRDEAQLKQKESAQRKEQELEAAKTARAERAAKHAAHTKSVRKESKKDERKSKQQQQQARAVVSRTPVTTGRHSNSSGGGASMKVYQAAGWEPLAGFQLRYVYFLDPSARSRLTVPVLPFNAIDAAGARMYLGKARPSQRTSGDQPESGGAAPTRTLQPKTGTE
jgi:hypothetical protein